MAALVRLLLLTGLAALLPTLAIGADGDAGDNSTGAEPRFRAAVALGLTQWSDLDDVDPLLPGSFDETGFGVDLAGHYQVARLGPARFLVGGDLGLVGHGSSIRGIEENEELQASLLYLTPSLKVAFGTPGRAQLFLDAGFGYYDLSVEEWEDDCFWDCDIYEYYDDSTTGGYLGLGADFPVGEGRLRITTSLRAHFVDFDDPVELGAGQLDGALWQWQFGAAFGL